MSRVESTPPAAMPWTRPPVGHPDDRPGVPRERTHPKHALPAARTAGRAAGGQALEQALAALQLELGRLAGTLAAGSLDALDATPTAAPAAPASYVVVPGDTLWSIAARHGVDITALHQANRDVIGPDPDVIEPGMVLVLPPASTAPVAPAGSDGAPPIEPIAPAEPAAPSSTPSAQPTDDAALVARIDEDVLAGTGLAGQGATIVEAARTYGVPVDFVLAMLRKESSFLSPENDLSIANNNPANLRWADWETEHGGEPGVGGFTRFPTIADGIRAQVHLLSRPPYDEMVARRDWDAVVHRWAPPSDGNDSALYARQMHDYSAEYRELLGVGEDWVTTTPAASPAAPAGPGTVVEGSDATAGAAGATVAPGEATWLSQAQGQATQWEDCGPASVVMALLAMGITPRGWDPANPAEAIEQVREDMGLARGVKTGGTNEGQVAAVLRSYGIDPTQTGDFDQMLSAVQSGRPLVLAGNTRTLPYDTNVVDKVNGVNHFLTVIGYDPASDRYGVYDPIAVEPGVKWLTADEVYAYTDAPGQHRGVIA